jgi:hypothetical protein
MSSRTLESSNRIDEKPGEVEARPRHRSRWRDFVAWIHGVSPSERWVLAAAILSIAGFTAMILVSIHLGLQSFVYN